MKPLLCQVVFAGVVLCGCAPMRIYWGDVHGHCENSDGKGTPAAYFAHARDEAHLDFVILSDHDFGNATPWRMPVETWRRSQVTADRFNEPGKFVAVAGYEWTSQPKYWGRERHFAGAPKYYNHKIVYFPHAVPYLLSAKDEAYKTPDRLAAAVAKRGGLIHNAHPGFGPKCRDQWAYTTASAATIANTEIMPDDVSYQGKRHHVGMESAVRSYLDGGGRTGLVAGSDTHEGHPVAKTAVLARELTREAVFDALRHRHCYAISHARIELAFSISGGMMGDVVEVDGLPAIHIEVRGTARLSKVELIRDGAVLRAVEPGARRVTLDFVDRSFRGPGYYYVRVTQTDTDQHGNPSRAWSSPIWVGETSS